MPDMPLNAGKHVAVSSERELYREICACIEEGIISGAFPEESQIPSTNRLARLYMINPATALKGVNLLVDQGVLYKRRGIGMFVSTGARDMLLEPRRGRFASEYVRPLVNEAVRLGITRERLIEMIDEEEL